MIVNRYPLFRAFLLFCSGILLANFVPLSFSFFLLLLAFSGIASVILAYWKAAFYSYQYRWTFGLAMSAFFFSLGIVLSQVYSEKQFANHLNELPKSKVYAEVQLLEEPREKTNSFGMEARLLRFGTAVDSLVDQETKLMLYLQKRNAARNLRYGDRVVVHTYLNELKAPQNPYEFDYRGYLNLRSVYAQAYADSSSWKKLSSNNGWALIKYSSDLRRYLLQVIDSWNLSEAQTAVSKALLLGYRYDIDDNTLKAYASAGAMHVLAVSGLHVGVVYMMTGYLLFFFGRIKHGQIIKSIVLVLLLWGFALLTGLSASVVRASTMFTAVAIGSGFKRHTSIYNTILASAMFLLFIKPTYLFEVGFQLSYAAVFGIVWMQPQIEKLIKPKNRILKWVWGITTVSLAAQLVTFPLGLYYFHQFPTMFLISNLIVIPLVIALMYLGVPILVLSGLGVNLSMLVKLYAWLLSLMNKGVLFVERQAGFLITEIHITRFELVVFYVMIISAFWWLISGGFRKLVIALFALVFLGASQLREEVELNNSTGIYAYAAKGHSAVGLYNKEQAIFIADSTLLADDDALTFHVKHHWWALDAKPTFFCLEEIVSNSEGIMSFGNYLLYIYNNKAEILPQVDLIFVTEGYPHDNLTASENLQFILSSALGFTQRQKWKGWCEEHHLNYHDINESGCFQWLIPEGNGQ